MTCVHPNGKVLIDWDYVDGKRTPSDSPTETAIVSGQVVTRLKANVVQELQCPVCLEKEVVRP